ncbi:hypothetical protein BPO_1123 [Bergeyella porcorum]|uniref:Lipoprotein n=1 Tax=Bergeyella porcorum TaxID=1735111 RepID=A0AAU0F0D5_9FLAO
MNTLLKTFGLVLIALFSSCQAQQTEKISIKNSKIIEANKKEFIGKPLSYLLSKINVEIKSVLPVPNKNRKEINCLYLRFVNNADFQKTNSKAMKDRPTQLTIVFNQNWGLDGETCKSAEVSCGGWTKEDEKNLGDLIIYDVYVVGKD